MHMCFANVLFNFILLLQKYNRKISIHNKQNTDFEHKKLKTKSFNSSMFYVERYLRRKITYNEKFMTDIKTISKRRKT